MLRYFEIAQPASENGTDDRTVDTIVIVTELANFRFLSLVAVKLFVQNGEFQEWTNDDTVIVLDTDNSTIRMFGRNVLPKMQDPECQNLTQRDFRIIMETAGPHFVVADENRSIVFSPVEEWPFSIDVFHADSAKDVLSRLSDGDVWFALRALYSSDDDERFLRRIQSEPHTKELTMRIAFQTTSDIQCKRSAEIIQLNTNRHHIITRETSRPRGSPV